MKFQILRQVHRAIGASTRAIDFAVHAALDAGDRLEDKTILAATQAAHDEHDRKIAKASKRYRNALDAMHRAAARLDFEGVELDDTVDAAGYKLDEQLATIPTHLDA